ncbi:hypothetical protein B1R94_19875 [Mycolicibacterium litorale]|nr:hypothetical protein B1R94_19875 [Mycolicibacterium litorale]
MTLFSHAATAALLADGSGPERFGVVVGSLAIPVIGIILLVVGLYERSKARRARPPYPAPPPWPPPAGYPPPYPGTAPPGYPPPYPGAFPPGGYPPVPPPKTTAGRGLIIAGSILVGVTVVGTVARTASGLGDTPASDTAAPPVAMGQCITGSAMSSGLIREKDIADCADPNAVFEVASIGGADASCPDGRKVDTRFARWTNQAATVCFIPNLATDHCYRTVKGQPTQANPYRSDTIELVECADSSAEFAVVRRADTVNFGLCPSGTNQILFTTPARTYCTAPAR